MADQVRIQSKIKCESFLIGVLYMIGTLSLYEDVIRRGRPYVYSTIMVLQLLIIKTWMRIPSNNTLHYFLSLETANKLLSVCRLNQIPDRRTLDRRFHILPLKEIIGTMGGVFLSERLVENTTASVDSSMLKAAGPVWHKSDMKQNRIPISGIDTDARWGFSKSKGWVYGYKLHMSCSTGRLIVPLSADFTTANVADNSMYESLMSPLADLLENIIADPAYDDGQLYQYSKENNLRLVCPIKKYDSTPPERLELIEFYESKQGQEVYSDRKISIEPLFEILKSTFGIRVMPVRGFENARSFVLVCVLVYQLMVYYNCMTEQENPRIVKRMLCN
ncbi:MAG: transposase [Nitrosarchaeum sp.]